MLQVPWIPVKSNGIEAPQSFVTHGAAFSLEKELVLPTLMFAPNTERRIMVVGWNIAVTVQQSKYLKCLKIFSPTCPVEVIYKTHA
jgi:hypothetical protein